MHITFDPDECTDGNGKAIVELLEADVKVRKQKFEQSFWVNPISSAEVTVLDRYIEQYRKEHAK